MKKLCAVLLTLAVVLALSGCHGSRNIAGFAVPDAFDTSRDYEITFWAKNDTNKTQVDIYKQAIADFQVLYPNITVNLRLYTDYGRIYNDVITNIATNTTPNVCITYPDHIATYLTGGDNTVVPLDQLMDHPQYGLGGSQVAFDGPTREQVVPKFLDECVVNGVHYALPYMRSTEACYVNKTYVEKLGYELPEVLTWDFVWEVSEKAMAKDEGGNFLVNGQKVMQPFIYKSTDNMMIQLLRQSGADYSTGTGQVLLFNDTTRALLRDIGAHASTGSFNTFKSTGYPGNYLNAGQCIFAVDSTAGATWMGCDAPLLDIPADQIVEFEIAVLPIPQVDTQHPTMISQGPSVCIFNKEDPQEVLASWLFTQFLLTDEVQIAYAQTEGYAPVTSKAQSTRQYQDYLAAEGSDNELHYGVKLQATRLLLENVENTFVTPVFNGSASLRNAAGELIEETKKSGRRGETIDDKYLDALFAEITARCRLDQITADSGKRVQLGALPGESAALLAVLAVAWVMIAIYAALQWQKSKKISNSH